MAGFKLEEDSVVILRQKTADLIASVMLPRVELAGNINFILYLENVLNFDFNKISDLFISFPRRYKFSLKI